MNYSEMLHDFVDSALPTTEEETLFHALAADDDLRFELKYLLTLRDTVRDDDEARFVPLMSTGAVFARLGYAIPAGVGAVGGAAGSGGLMALLKSWGGYGAAALVGALLTGGIFMATEASADHDSNAFDRAIASADATSMNATAPNGSMNRTSGASTPLSTSSPSPLSSTSSISGTPAMNAPVMRMTSAPTPPFSRSSSRTVVDDNAKIRDSELSVATPDRSSLELIDDANVTTALPRSAATLETTPIRISEQWLREASRIDTNNDPTLQKPAEPADPRDVKGVQGTPSFTFRASSTPVELTSPTMTSSSGTNQFEWAVGGFYPLTRTIAVGAEAGRESYLLTFREHRADGRINLYEVTPMITWVTPMIRWMPFGDASLSPFLQGSFGFSEAGLMERGMLGLQLRLADKVMMTGGAEFSAVQYRYQNETYSSPRFGVSYGITFNPF